MEPEDRDEAVDPLLRNLLAGDVHPEAPEVRAAFRERPELEARWRSLRSTGDALDEAGALARQVLADPGPVPADWDERALETLRAEAPAALARGVPWSRLATLAAALVGLLALTIFLRREPAPDVYLGDPHETPVVVQPVGTADAAGFERFEWRFEPEGVWDGHCQVVVYDDAGVEWMRGAKVFTSSDDGLWTWTPSLEQRERLTALGGFAWRITAVLVGGAMVSSPPSSVDWR